MEKQQDMKTMKTAAELKQKFIEEYKPPPIPTQRVWDFNSDLNELLKQVAKERCGECAFNFHPKGYHDVEEFHPNED